MPGPRIQSTTGNAKIVKQGHTSSGAHGTSPSASRKYPKGEPKELKK